MILSLPRGSRNHPVAVVCTASRLVVDVALAAATSEQPAPTSVGGALPKTATNLAGAPAWSRWMGIGSLGVAILSYTGMYVTKLVAESNPSGLTQFQYAELDGVNWGLYYTALATGTAGAVLLGVALSLDSRPTPSVDTRPRLVGE